MRILSLDGGGYLGLASAAFLTEIERHFGTTCHDQFDLFCGTSTGAIIALGLAAGMSAREIAALYERLGPRVFFNPFPGVRLARTWLRGMIFARYSNHQLKAALRDAFSDLTLGDLRAKNKFALIAAFSVTSGKPRVFKTDHAPELTLDDQYLVRDVALASAAAPVFLPMVTLPAPGSGIPERFCDGGLFANHPALLGYAEAISHLRVAPDDVRILSISTPRSELAERDSARGPLQQFLLSRGLISWGTKLAGVMIDSTSLIAHETLRRLMGWPPGAYQRYVRVELPKPHGLDLDIATKKATRTLHHIGTERARTHDTRMQLMPFFRA